MKTNDGKIQKKKFTMEDGKKLLKRTFSVLHPVAVKIGKLTFWGIALLGLILRIFVMRPFGALLALTAGCIWIYYNIHMVKQLLINLLTGLTRLFSGDVETSLWFEYEGREKIRELISALSMQGVSYCNLVEQIKDLPPVNHWYAISKGLHNMGIVTQVSRSAFYITWHLPTEDSHAA